MQSCRKIKINSRKLLTFASIGTTPVGTQSEAGKKLLTKKILYGTRETSKTINFADLSLSTILLLLLFEPNFTFDH